jgi:cation:H+ antiporter
MASGVAVFLLGAAVSLGASWLLVARLERIGDRLGLSEALLGLLAALAADAPEVTAAATALVRGQHEVGTGVVVGSNVFNLAALLGLSAIVAGGIALHRRVVLLGGVVAVWVACACLGAVTGVVPPVVALAVALVVLMPYGAVIGTKRRGFARLRVPERWVRWLAAAVAEEEQELQRGRRVQATSLDAVVACLALVVVVGSSVLMEGAATALGERYAVPQIVVGGVVLAAVTSLPNAVAAIYLAARGRGAAVLSTALNSNALNVVVGLLIPGAVVGLGAPSSMATLTAAWYTGLTVLALALAYLDRGLRRDAGTLILAGYLVFVGLLLATLREPSLDPALPIAVAAGVTAVAILRPAIALLVRSLEGRESLLPGWSAHRLWALGLGGSSLVAVTDALLGSRVILIGLLIVGPCCVLLTGRWVPTALTAGGTIGLAVLLGLPDGIWGTQTHLLFVAAVAIVALANTAAAVLTDCRRGPH